MMDKSTFERSIERATGEQIESLRTTPIAVRREKLEAIKSRPTDYYSAFPVIGRGNILRDSFVTHKDCERMLDDILGKK